GIGIACVMVPAFSTGTLGVDQRQAGAAAATVNTAQQVGGSLGTALLNTIATGATAAYLATHERSTLSLVPALVHGYATATASGGASHVRGGWRARAMTGPHTPPGGGARRGAGAR